MFLSPFCFVFQEIYPPKLHQFAYITDGACTEDEIVCMELIIMKVSDGQEEMVILVLWF